MKFRALIAALLLLTGVTASAAQTPIEGQNFPSISNLLVNAGFENGKYGWTASGGATATVNTTAKLQGSYGYDWNSNGAAQTLLSQSITIPEHLKGKSGLAFCSIKTVSGSATHTLTVNDGTNDLVTAQSITTTTSAAPRSSVNFIFPTSGTIRLKLASVAADEPEIYIDACYLGEATNVQQVSQATVYGGLEQLSASGCTYAQSTSSGFTDYENLGNGTGCNDWFGIGGTTAGGISNSSANTLQAVAPSMPPGRYLVMLTGRFVASSSNSCYFRFSDGLQEFGMLHAFSSTGSITNGPLTGFVEYTTTANRTFTVKSSDNSSVTCSLLNDTAGAENLQWYFYRFPTASETVYRPDLYNWRVDANISGANVLLGTSDVSSYTGMTNASLTLANNTGRGVITAQIPCSSTNSPTGTTCAVGDESVGVSFTLPAAGDVMACVQFSHLYDTNEEDGMFAFEIVETPSNAQTITQEGKEKVSFGFDLGIDAPINDAVTPVKVCSPFSFSSAGQKTLRLFYEQDVSGITASNILADALATVGQRQVHWEVYPINQAIPAPILVGSVTSNTTGQLRIEGVRSTPSCTSNPCAITDQTSSWVSSITRSSAGTYSINFAASVFTAAPFCTCNSNTAGSTAWCIVDAPTTAKVDVNLQSNNTTKVDSGFHVVCMGQR